MTIALAAMLGAVLAFAPSNLPAPRFLVLHLRVDAYGVAGTGIVEIDRRTGRFVRRLNAGPASESE